MYLEHFGFQREPFNITPDSRFLFLSGRHKEAMAALLYGINQRKGFIALTGEIGSGKTTICRSLLKELDRDEVRLALILNPQLNDLELLQAINAEFGLEHSSTSKRELLNALNQFLLAEAEAGMNCVLVIDESQRLSPDTLEQVRLISNLELEDRKLIQIALVGQPELDDLLHLPELEQLNQRITVRCHIDPLDPEETADYIAHRLDIAEPSATVLFDDKALKGVFNFSRGVPRKINVVCDRALLAAFVDGEHTVTGPHVRKAVEEVAGKRRAASASRGHNTPPPDTPPSPSRDDAASTSPAAAMAGGRGFGMIALALLAGLIAIAFAIGTNGGGDDAGEGPALAAATPTMTPEATPPPTPTPSPTPIPEPQDTPTPTATPSPTPTPEPTIEPAPPVEIAAATPSPTPTPESTPTPSPTPTPTETPGVTPTPEPEVDASPSPSPTPDATPEATPEPETTPEATPSSTPTPSPTPTATPEPTPSPTPTPTPTPPATPTPTPTPPAPPAPWTYDGDGVVRIDEPGFAFAASALTWLAENGVRLPDTELERMGALPADAAASLKITSGASPLYLREVRLPPAIQGLRPEVLPVLVQVDTRADGFGPWAVLRSVDGDGVTLADPLRGVVKVGTEDLEGHLAGVTALYRDSAGLTGLGPGDAGESVRVLQRRLSLVGAYEGDPSGVFDGDTEDALAAYRGRRSLPLAERVDAMTVLALMGETP